MILNHWWDQCGHYHIVPSKQTPVVDSIAAYPHYPLFVRKFKEQAVEELGPTASEDAHHLQGSKITIGNKYSNINISPEHQRRPMYAEMASRSNV